MAKGGSDEDYFKCNICLDNLVNPRGLPCLHTFCEPCICSHIVATERRAGRKITDYPCPVCRAVVTPKHPDTDARTWAASLPHNFTIASLMSLSNSRETEKLQCNLCERSKIHISASIWCYQCREAYCNDCHQYHRRMKSSMDHSVTKIDNLLSDSNEMYLRSISDVCPFHNSKVIDFFCFDHQELCCIICVTLHHKDCKNNKAIEELNKGHNSATENWNTVIKTTEKILKNRQKEMKEMGDSFRSISKTSTNFVRNAKDKLNILLDRLLIQVETTKKRHEITVDDNIKLITDFLNHMREMEKVTTFIRKYGSATQLFIHLQSITNGIYPKLQNVIESLKNTKDKKMSVTLEDVLDKLHTLQDIGEVTVQSKNESACFEECNTLSELAFKGIQLRKKKTISLSEYTFYTGLCILENTVLAHVKNNDNVHKMIAIDTVTLKTIAECVIPKISQSAYDSVTESTNLSENLLTSSDYLTAKANASKQDKRPESAKPCSIFRQKSTAEQECKFRRRSSSYSKSLSYAFDDPRCEALNVLIPENCCPGDIAYDHESKIIVMSCSCRGKHLYSLEINENAGSLIAPSDKWNIHNLFTNNEQSEYIKSINIHKQMLFVIVGNLLLITNVSMKGEIQTLCQLKYFRCDVKKLTIDSLNNNLIITSNRLVVGISFDGKECYKEDNYSVTAVVAAKGILFYGCKLGHIAIRSTIGKHDRVLLERCDKIRTIQDIWLDTIESKLFIYGEKFYGEKYIEMYEILF